jgi:hypothetical protein
MKIESTDQDIRNLLSSGYFRIPQFQRPYSWTRENIHDLREVAAPKTDSNGDAMTGTAFDCASCRHYFPQGDGGKTGGMCELCFDAALLRGHEQVTTSQKT